MLRFDQKQIAMKQSLGSVPNIMVRYMELQVDCLHEVRDDHSLMDQSLKKADCIMLKSQLKVLPVLVH